QKQENQRLKSALSYSKTQEFIEKEARNKLFMVKTGEQKILISKEAEKAQEEKEKLPNWREWWNLFF
ncbi:MAG: septum formation initiator family protein, partial [Patescibacteria group bacterium]